MSGPIGVATALTDDEREILRCWRATSVRLKIESLGVLQRNAELCQRIKLPVPVPALRLASADGKAVDDETA